MKISLNTVLQTLIIILLLLNCSFINSQETKKVNFSSTSTRLEKLNTLLFPYNSKNDQRKSYYGCVTEHDSLILYMRKNQPNADSVLRELKFLFYLKDTSFIEPLEKMLGVQISYFRKEWEGAFRQYPWCPKFRKQVMIIDGFERVIFGLKKFGQIPLDSILLESILAYNKSIFYSRFKHYITYYETDERLQALLDRESYQKIANLTTQEVSQMERANNYRWNDYTKRIATELNAFGGNSPDWNYFSPYLELVHSKLKSLYMIYLHSENKRNIEYRLLYDLFISTLSPEEVNNLNN